MFAVFVSYQDVAVQRVFGDERDGAVCVSCGFGDDVRRVCDGVGSSEQQRDVLCNVDGVVVVGDDELFVEHEFVVDGRESAGGDSRCV